MNCIKQKSDVLWKLHNNYELVGHNKLMLVTVFLRHEIGISVTC